MEKGTLESSGHQILEQRDFNLNLDNLNGKKEKLIA